MRLGIASQTNAFKVYNVATDEALDGTSTVTFPNFELQKNSVKVAGLIGEINVPTGIMSALTATISNPMFYGPSAKFYRLGETMTLDFRASITVTNPDTRITENVPLRWVLEGPIGSLNPGSKETATAGSQEMAMEIYKALCWMDGDEILRWDVFKYEFVVEGKDMLADVKQNLGL